jgi:CRP/FNR family transcriptional regulator
MNGLLVAVSPNERQLARQTFARCPRHELPPSALLSDIEPRNSRLLVVEEGVVALVAAADSQHPSIVALARRGDVLAPPAEGEHIRALTAARVALVPPGAYERLLSLPGVAQALLESVLDALGKRQQSLASTRGNHAERLQETLYRLARDHGKVHAEGVEIDVPLTHELLAQMVGSARETVTCTLARFQREGLLVRKGRTYRLIVAPDLLEVRPGDRPTATVT